MKSTAAAGISYVQAARDIALSEIEAIVYAFASLTRHHARAPAEIE
jgi:hypothetical protein